MSAANDLPLAGGTMTGPLLNNTNSASTALKITQGGSGYAATFIGGYVGIGTAIPAAPLDVYGPIYTSGMNAYTYSSGTQSLAIGPFTMANASGTANVGIGGSVMGATSTGGYNTSVGVSALMSDTTGIEQYFNWVQRE